MSRKNLSVNLKNGFKDYKDLSEIYTKFKSKLNRFKFNSLVAAISGGPDSLALAALSKAYGLEKKIKIYYVLVNHNIRKNSKSEASQVKRLLKKYHINLEILSNSQKINKNIQAKARQIRYEILHDFCLKKKVKIILTAHNLEDQVETFFIRLSRGSGLTGLSAMKTMTVLKKNIRLFRPLLDIKKNQLIKISKKIFGTFFIDPSNKDTKYLRTKIRSLKRPLSKSGIDYDQIIRSIKNLASSKKTLDQYMQAIFKKTVLKYQNEIRINYKIFSKLNNEVKIYVLNEAIRKLKNNYYNLRSKKVLSLIRKVNSKRFSSATLGGCIFLMKKDNLCLKEEKLSKYSSF